MTVVIDAIDKTKKSNPKLLQEARRTIIANRLTEQQVLNFLYNETKKLGFTEKTTQTLVEKLHKLLLGEE